MANASEGGESAVRARSVASPLPSSFLPRPGLEARLDEAFGKRLTVIVAGAGFGKSTLLASWAADVRCAWYAVDAGDAQLPSLARGIVGAIRRVVAELPPQIAAPIEGAAGEDELSADAFAGHLCEKLEQVLRHDLVLVLDDVHELGARSGGIRLVQSLCRQAPPTLHVVLASRAEPPFSISRLRGRGEVLELDASDLAFTVAEVGAFVESVLGEGSEQLAGVLHEATAGWPAEVRLATEALRQVPAEERGAALARLRQEGPLFAYVAEEVLEREPAGVRELLRRVAWFDHVTPPLCDALGLPEAGSRLVALARRGLLVRAEETSDGSYSLHGLLREFVRERWPLTDRELRGVQERASAWFEASDQPVEALRCSMAAGDPRGLARLLAERGDELVAAGAAEALLQAARLVPVEGRDERLEQAVGDAQALRGEWEEALACFERAAGDAEVLPPALAWRIGKVHFDRGELTRALEVYRQGRLDGSSPRDEALLLAAQGTVLFSRGESESALRLGGEALEAAERSGDPRALAAAHNVLMIAALGHDPDAAEEHGRRALEAAEAAGDILQTVRTRSNRAAYRHQEGAYEEALEELDAAIRLAELGGAGPYLAFPVLKRGEIRLLQGRLDEAIGDFETARAIYARYGSRKAFGALMELGEVYRERGDLALAGATLEEAIRGAERSEDAQVLMYAQSNLARVLTREDPERATVLAERAVSLGRRLGLGLVPALLSSGWVALARGDREAAAIRAAEAGDAGRRHHDLAGIAEALELEALAADEPARELGRLEEALDLWRELRNPIAEARVELALGTLVERPEARRAAARATRRLQKLGLRTRAWTAAGLLACLPPANPPAVAIRALGGFAVLRAGRPMPVSEWGSKKARDLLQILVARRGRPVARELLMEALWPGVDPAKLANRLSVALSLLRAALDPEHSFDPEHFVAGNRQAITLHAANLAIDVEDFVADAEAGLAMRAQGDLIAATELLSAAEAGYAGDFLEEVYDDWPVSLRESARSLYVTVARALAEDASAAGDDDAAARYLLRILERDAYDERAHLGLVTALARAGRHGEARRAYRTYCARMERIGVEAAPYHRPTA